MKRENKRPNNDQAVLTISSLRNRLTQFASHITPVTLIASLLIVESIVRLANIMTSSAIKPFSIAVPDEKLQRLKQKLALADFPNEIEGVEPWSQGPPVADIKRLTSYWANEFDWREIESKLNQFPQFVAPVEVDGFGNYNIHFVHQKSSVKNAIPLLFVHGWPGSFIEATRVVSELTKAGGDDVPAFHVVAPSLVDFGFSSKNTKKGFGIDQQAEALHKLMLALGYDEYVTQGGDLGCLVTRFLAIKYGKTHIKAQHLSNTAPAEPTEASFPELHAKCQSAGLSDGELAGLGRTQKFNTEGNGYYKKQATKPQTVGYFMTDTPVGLLAWLYECLHDWVDGYQWTDEEILTWVSIYYFSKPGPAQSSFVYWAIEHHDGLGGNAFVASGQFADVPVGVSRFPGDLILLPKLWNHTLGPVVFEREHEKGGHFAAWERPDAIVQDLRDMFGRKGGAFGVVTGKTGFD